LSVGSSNLSDEEEQIVSVDFVIRLEEKVANEEVGPISRVVMLLMGKKQNGDGEYDWLKSSGNVNE
jgi:hypothetical protein